MKTRFIHILALAALVLCSCSKSDYVNTIPSNASFVASVNLAEIANDADLANSKLLDLSKSGLSLLISGNSQDKIKGYIDNPADMGIDFREPAYAFKTDGECYGMAMKVASKGDLQDFIDLLSEQGLCTKATEKDNVFNGRLLDDIVYAFNGNTLLLLSNLGDGGTSMTKQMAVQLMAQDKDNSFASTPAFDKLESQRGDIKLYTNLAALPASFNNSVTALLPKNIKRSDLETVGSISFDKGSATLTSTIWSDNSEAQKLIKEASNNLHKIDGEFTDAPTEDFFLWATAGVNGEWLLNALKEDKEAKQMLFMIERGIDIEQMIRTIDGDFTVILPHSAFNLFDKQSDMMAFAQIKNSKFLDDVDYWKQSMKEYGMTMHNVGTHDYQLTLDDGTTVNWGVDDDGDELYLATSSALTRQALKAKSKVLEQYEDDIEKNVFYAYANLANMPGMSMFTALGRTGIKAFIVKAPSVEKIEMTIEMNSKDENILKQLLPMLSSFAL